MPPAARHRAPSGSLSGAWRAYAWRACAIVIGVVVGVSTVLAQAPPPKTHPPQADTVLLDVDLRVTATRLRPVGSSGQTWRTDEAPAATSLDQLLERDGVHVRDYGPGAISNLTVRGGSAAQTLALWNGLPVTNPSLGQIDWSLFGLGDGQRVTLTRGGNASAWGSGAVAATVSVDDLPAYHTGLRTTFGTTYGAFGERGARVHLRYGRGRWASSLQTDLRVADNDFPYAPAPGLEEVRQSNSAFRQNHLRAGLYHRLPGNGGALAFHYWLSDAAREIAPTKTQTRSAAQQDDRASRFSLRYGRQTRRRRFSATAGYFAESLDYRDSLSGVDSRSDFGIALADATLALDLPRRQTLTLGLTARHTRARVDDAYRDAPSEIALAGLATYALAYRNLRVQASGRYEYTTSGTLGLAPALGVELRPSPTLTLRGRLTRDFRAPTFNDRYYLPGGNPDLRPERGWSQEIGADLRVDGLQLSVTGFHRRLDDWLLWARQPDVSYFAAYNLAAVRSAGLEPRIRYNTSLGKGVRAAFLGGYDFVDAVNLRAIALPRIEAGEQLWYVPRHSAFATARVQLPRLSVSYTHRWRGETLGVNDDVAASQTGDVRLSLDRPWGTRSVRAFAEVRNVFDVDYELVERRALPGRQWRVGASLTLNLSRAASAPPAAPR